MQGLVQAVRAQRSMFGLVCVRLREDIFFETSEGDSLAHRLHFWGSRGVWDNMLARFRLHLEGLGVHGMPFGHHFDDLGDAWRAPKALLSPLGASCGIPATPWGPPGGILGGSGDHFGAILGAFGGPKWTKILLKIGSETRPYLYTVLGHFLTYFRRFLEEKARQNRCEKERSGKGRMWSIHRKTHGSALKIQVRGIKNVTKRQANRYEFAVRKSVTFFEICWSILRPKWFHFGAQTRPKINQKSSLSRRGPNKYQGRGQGLALGGRGGPWGTPPGKGSGGRMVPLPVLGPPWGNPKEGVPYFSQPDAHCKQGLADFENSPLSYPQMWGLWYLYTACDMYLLAAFFLHSKSSNIRKILPKNSLANPNRSKTTVATVATYSW